MLETLTLITLCVLYLVIFRSGKTPVLLKPLMIERVGLYRITLAPQINLAQPFVEAVARHIKVADGVMADGVEYVFAVRDRHVLPQGFDYYLLAVTRRAGILDFAATSPEHAAAESDTSADHGLAGELTRAVQKIAAEYGVGIELVRTR